MTLPVVSNQRLLGETDLRIRELAEAVSFKLGAGIKVATVGGTFTVNQNSDITVTHELGVPALGAVVIIGRGTKVYGQVQYAPGMSDNGTPIDVLMNTTYAHMYLINAAAALNTIWCSIRTSIWRGQTYDGNPVGYGSQRVQAGAAIYCYGFVWGAVQ